MTHGQPMPDRAIQPSFHERLEAIQDFLSATSGMLVQQAIFIKYGERLVTAERSTFFNEQLTKIINENVEVAAEALISLKEDTADNLGIISPDDSSACGKLRGLTYSKEKMAYVGTALMPDAARIDWPILDTAQLFIGNMPPRTQTLKLSGGNIAPQTDLSTRLHSVVFLNNESNQWRH